MSIEKMRCSGANVATATFCLAFLLAASVLGDNIIEAGTGCSPAQPVVEALADAPATNPDTPALREELAKLREDVVDKLQGWTGHYVKWCSIIVAGGALLVTVTGALNIWRSIEAKREVEKASQFVREQTELATALIERLKEQARARYDDLDRKLESMKQETAGVRDRYIQEVHSRASLFAGYVDGLRARMKKGLPVDEKSVRQILDEIFAADLDKYEVRSFLADLDSAVEQERIAAVWALQEIGGEPELRALQKVVADTKESADVRVQAERSVQKMLKRLDP